MARYTTRVLYSNTHYRRRGGRSRGPGSRVATFLPLALLLGAAWFGYGWYQDVLTGEQDCAPFCGVLPGPGGSPDEATFDAATGWNVTYRRDWFGDPAEESPSGLTWAYGEAESVGLRSSSELDPEASCRVVTRQSPKGFDLLYTVPNASIGDQVGVGAAYERTVARPGKSPRRIRRFQICVTAGDIGLVGYAEGPREKNPVANHADPATTETAFLLGELAASVEFIDHAGRPLSPPATR